MKTLHLTLKKKWFDQILAGTKKIEYREIKPYWTTRLFDDGGNVKKFEVIEFRNGYSKDCKKMKVEWEGIQVNEKKGDYEILLGKILEK